jgi:prepilin-type processing-associated H-X9-DG protein
MLKRNKAFTYIQVVTLFAFLGGVAAVIIWPNFGGRGDRRSPSSAFQSNLKQIGLGIKQYIQDYDEKFPLASAGEAGWSEVIQPYVRSWQLFQCASDKTPDFPQSLTTDYFYNSRLAEVEEIRLVNIENVLMIGDGLSNQAANSSLTSIPAHWSTDSKSPAYRHQGGANYGYADGHIKWLKPTSIGTGSPKSSRATFAIK